MTKAQLLAVGSTAEFGGTVTTECWYCGETPTEPWRSQVINTGLVERVISGGVRFHYGLKK